MKGRTFVLSENYDSPTNIVCSWLFLSGRDFLRINTEKPDSTLIIEKSNKLLKKYNSFYFNLNGISELRIDLMGSENGSDFSQNSIWFRRPHGQSSRHEVDIQSDKVDQSLLSALIKNLEEENDVLYKFYIDKIVQCCSRTIRNSSKLNKLTVLLAAQNFGLHVPKTIVTNSKASLISFYKENSTAIITKSHFNSIHGISKNQNKSFSSFTSKVSKRSINEIPNTFKHSMFQEEIKKEHDIRSVYFANKFYSCAIFSQQNKKTRVDCRNYDFSVPNRIVPFQLSIDIENKIRKLLDCFNIEFAVIDLILSKKGIIYFLEVNPYGQFSALSNLCNYNIEYEIFKYLTHENQ